MIKTKLKYYKQTLATHDNIHVRNTHIYYSSLEKTGIRKRGNVRIRNKINSK